MLSSVTWLCGLGRALPYLQSRFGPDLPRSHVRLRLRIMLRIGIRETLLTAHRINIRSTFREPAGAWVMTTFIRRLRQIAGTLRFTALSRLLPERQRPLVQH